MGGWEGNRNARGRGWVGRGTGSQRRFRYTYANLSSRAVYTAAAAAAAVLRATPPLLCAVAPVCPDAGVDVSREISPGKMRGKSPNSTGFFWCQGTQVSTSQIYEDSEKYASTVRVRLDHQMIYSCRYPLLLVTIVSIV